MGLVEDKIIFNNFLYILRCVEDAQTKYFGLKERELVFVLKG
jgi:hypothetical protein